MSGIASLSASGSVIPAAPSTSASTINIPYPLSEMLKAHQVEGLHFLWKRLIDDGLLWAGQQCRGAIRVDDRMTAYGKAFGAVLGHSMGLGKSLTSLCFIMLLQGELHRRIIAANKRLSDPVIPPYAACSRLRVLVVAPRSCLPHWEQSVNDWIREDLFASTMPLYIPSFRPRESITVALEKFYRVGGILVLGYEEHTKLLERLDMHLDRLTNTPLPPRNAEATHRHITSLLDFVRPPPPPLVARWKATCATYSDILRGADVVLLDESHRLKNVKSIQVKELTKNIATVPVRIALTGTPLQNHLTEYMCMTNVVSGVQIDAAQFRHAIVLPIERGQCIDATKHDFDKMQACVGRLRMMFAKMVHRCGVELLERSLPPRFETILFVELSSAQERRYHEMLQRRGDSMKVLEMRHEASRICAHPVLVDSRYYTRDMDTEGDVDGQGADGFGDAENQQQTLQHDNSRKRQRSGFDIPLSVLEHAKLDDSPKLRLCIDLIKQILQRGEKVVVFAMYIGILQLTAHFLTERRIDYFMLTGDTLLERRRAMMQEFRAGRPGTPSVFMCSTKAGGVGINLLPANHCILLDTSWNPADDCQATFRIYRYGQTLPVYTYRLCSYGTAEHVVFSYAVRKEWTHRKVADVNDPHRREREERVHYAQYPCTLPLPGWVLNDNVPGSPSTRPKDRIGGIAHARHMTLGFHRKVHVVETSSDSDASSEDEARGTPRAVSVNQRRSGATPPRTTHPLVTFRQFLERSCPLILALHAQVQSTVVAAVEHSFLLRDNTDEIIVDLHRQLEEKSKYSRLLLERPTHRIDADDDNDDVSGVKIAVHARGAGTAPPRNLQHPLLPIEGKVTAIANAFADALWQRHQQAQQPSFGQSVHDRATWERLVASAWCDLLAQLSTDGDLHAPQTGNVSGVLQFGYRLACAEFCKNLKHSTIRATLEAHCRMALQLDLVTALTTKGATVWERLPASVACECLTEQSFKRPFVQQMLHMGIRLLLWKALQLPRIGGNVSDTVTAAIERIVPHRVLEDGGDFVHPLLHIGISTSQQLRVLDEFLDNLVQGIWPEYKGIPSAPQASEARLRAARQPLLDLLDPNRQLNRPIDSASVLTMAQAAFIAGIPLSADESRRGQYLCSQCSRGIVRIRGPHETLDLGGIGGVRVCCDVCNFDVVDSFLYKPALRSELLLERWSTALLSLADFDVPASLSAEFALDELTHVNAPTFLFELIRTRRFAKGLFRRDDANCSLFSGLPPSFPPPPLALPRAGAAHSLPRLLYAVGIDVALSQVPSHHLMMLALQCGTTTIKELAHRLVVYGSGAYEHAKATCRSTLQECWSQLRPGSEVNDNRVPEMFVLLGLHYTASFDISCTADLIDDAAFRGGGALEDDDDYLRGEDEPARCLRLVAFREVCYALAWSLYRTRLAQQPLPKDLVDALRHHKKPQREAKPQVPSSTEYLPWADDPARDALNRAMDDLDESSSSTNSFMSQASIPSPLSTFGSDDDSDVDEGTQAKVAHTWTRTKVSFEGAIFWASEELDGIRRHRTRLLWTSLVEVFGAQILTAPVWAITRTSPHGSDPDRVEASQNDDETFSSELLFPDDELRTVLGNVTPMAPAQAADAFFRMMLDAASDVVWVG